MRYYRIELQLPEDYKEVLMAELGELPFDTFDDSAPGLLRAWIPVDAFDEGALAEIKTAYADQIIGFVGPVLEEEQNWNQVWESQYEPVEIADFVRIRAPFHDSKAGFKFELLITPKMSFGTGHHDTTAGMIRRMGAMDFAGKRVLDMGCGTGVLGILALKLGASHVHGIDIEAWAVENSLENASQNEVAMQVELGDAKMLAGRYDVILANINRNIIMRDLPLYVAHMSAHGQLLCSGFYTEDVALLVEKAAAHGLKFVEEHHQNNWATILYTK